MTPAGWILEEGLYKNSGVLADPHAIERRGYMAFDLETLSTVILPWADGSGQTLYHTPMIPIGTVIGTPVENEAGWDIPCTGPLTKISVVDLQLTQWGSHLRNFHGEGLKVIWWMPTSAVKDDGDGFWRPKRSAVTSPLPFSANVQPLMFEEPQDAYVPGSVAYYGASHKHNNRIDSRGELRAYHTGKIWHSPAPLALFWDADGAYLGKVQGRLEWDGMEVKAFPMAEMAPFLAVASEVSIDATLGYTTAGATSSLADGHAAHLGVMSEEGNVDNINIYGAGAQSFLALFNGGAVDNPATATLVANSRVPATAWNAIVNPEWHQETYTVKPALSSGNRVWGAFMRNNTGGSHTLRYDLLGSPTNAVWVNNTAYAGGPPDPYPATGFLLGATANNAGSMYITYTVPTAGILPSTRMTLGLGLRI